MCCLPIKKCNKLKILCALDPIGIILEKVNTVFPHRVSAETIIFLIWKFKGHSTLQIYTAGIGTHVKSVKVTSICHRYYHVKV